MRDGQGSAYNSDGSLKYTGSWKQDRPHGIGTAYYSLYNARKKSFESQNIHGLFSNGVYVGPYEERSNRNLAISQTYNYGFGSHVFRNAKSISDSLYRKVYTWINDIYRKLLRYFAL